MFYAKQKGGNMSTYRKYLGANVGHEAVLHSNNFELINNKCGYSLLLLKDYEVKHIKKNNLNVPRPKHSGHLWVKVPDWLLGKSKKISDIAKKISLRGVIYRYNYKDKEGKNVTINLKDINLLKPKKSVIKERKRAKYA